MADNKEFQFNKTIPKHVKISGKIVLIICLDYMNTFFDLLKIIQQYLKYMYIKYSIN